MPNFKLILAADKAEILLYDVIGEDMFGGISARAFAEELGRAKSVKQIDVRINSPGGDAFAGITMHNLLRSHPANVTTFVDGLAASAASIVAVAGDQVEMASNAMMMIHRAWTIAMGNAQDFEKQAHLLNTIDGTLAETYAAKTGGDAAGILEQMTTETWLTAEQAMDQGFADRIGQEHAIAACVRPELFKYKYVPPQFVDKSPLPETIPLHRALKQELSQFERTLPHYVHAKRA